MVYTLGETVLDIIIGSSGETHSTAGGSMLNASVSLSRLGLGVEFISEVGNDNAGQQIIQFLHQNAVSTNFLTQYKHEKTHLALAHLDEYARPSYSFYRIPPLEPASHKLPDFTSNDFLLFGSFFAIEDRQYDEVKRIRDYAKSMKACLVYDPNFRTPHLKDLSDLKPRIINHMRNADIVKGSDEDFLNIFETKTATETWNHLKNEGVDILIYTMGKEGAALFTKKCQLTFAAPAVEVKSTIGAGDNFNAGLLTALQYLKKSPIEISESEWKKIIPLALDCASEVCTIHENYIPEAFARNILQKHLTGKT
ncbi:MAG: carbohydrate kinase [Bacteroidales bacterium]|nr:carbohydrate kinase [Bacteroidales bacterium]